MWKTKVLIVYVDHCSNNHCFLFTILVAMPIYKFMLCLQHVNMLMMMLKFAMVVEVSSKNVQSSLQKIIPWTKKLGKEGKNGKTLVLLQVIYTPSL